MTDRHAAYLVTLAKDIREDDAEPTLNALRQIKGVSSVQPVPVDLTLAIATERAASELRGRIIGVLYPRQTERP